MKTSRARRARVQLKAWWNGLRNALSHVGIDVKRTRTGDECVIGGDVGQAGCPPNKPIFQDSPTADAKEGRASSFQAEGDATGSAVTLRAATAVLNELPPPPSTREEKQQQQTQQKRAVELTSANFPPPAEFCYRLIVCAEVLVSQRLLVTYGSYIDPWVYPKRLSGWDFDATTWTLHPTLSWEEIGQLVEQDQKNYGLRRFSLSNCPWLASIAFAADKLGVAKRHLTNEVIALAPAKRVRYLYSADGIRDHVEAESWVSLAERLATDKALVAFAFFREPSTASAVLDCIERLERQYYDLIKMDEHGELLGYIGKTSRPATPDIAGDGVKREDDANGDGKRRQEDSSYSGAPSLESTFW